MKAKLSVLVDELRGKAGTVVGKQSSNGQIMQVHSYGHNPNSQSQIKSRLLLVSLAKAWAELAQTQRDDWNTAAAPALSGYALFCERCTNRNNIGLSFLTNFVNPGNLPVIQLVTAGIDLTQRIFNVRIDNVDVSGTCNIRIRISQFTRHLMSLQTYKYRLVSQMQATKLAEKNIFEDVIKVNKSMPIQNTYFVLAYDFVNRDAGNSTQSYYQVLQWNDQKQPFIPDATLQIDEDGTYYWPNDHTGEVAFNFVVNNFKSSVSLLGNSSGAIYNDIECTDIFSQAGYIEDIEIEKSMTLSKGIDGYGFSSDWNVGVTKYIKLSMQVKVVGTQEIFTFQSQVLPVTAKNHY